MASTEGGMDIEEVAEHNPEAIHKIWADPGVGLLRYQKVNLGKSLGFPRNCPEIIWPDV